MNRDSNLYTFLFATIMVFVVATVLAYTSQSLKELQLENVRKEKMQNILSTVGVIIDRDGAEITQDWFQESFINEKLFDSNNNLMGIKVSKTNNDPKNSDKNDHEVDAISGATITGDGVSDMIKERLEHYIPYFNTLRSKSIALN